MADKGGIRPCMTEDEYAAWSACNDQLADTDQASSPCRDCRRAFALEMRAAGTCDGKYPRERIRPKRASRRHTDANAARAEAQRRHWADPAYRAYVMERRAASKKLQGAPAHRDRRAA